MTDKNAPKKTGKKPTPKPAAKKATPSRTAARKTAPKSTPKGKPAPARKSAPAKKAAPKKPDTAKAAQSAAQSVTDMVGEAKRAVGRPAKYSDDFIPQMIAYFNIETERIEEVAVKGKDGLPVTDKEGNVLMEKVVVKNKFPTLERFAARIGVTRETLHDWATAVHRDDGPLKGSLIRPEFSYTYARAKDLQAALLQEGGLDGLYESRIVQFALKNLSGWKDQTEQTVVADITTTDATALDDIYEEGIRNSAEAKQQVLKRKLAGIIPGQAGATGQAVHDADDEE
ncbi:terminase small subunit [Paraburkholderia sediminicola]|uniref:terminase small subunit n=1 Tax=Paraburkholderia sediminicola TaxID=458836 RepID=UPI0038B85C77